MTSRFRTRGSSRTRRQRLYEALEPRVMLCGQLDATYWTGAGDGIQWHDPLNWSTSQVPGILDDVVIHREPQRTPDPIAVTESAQACTIESSAELEIIGSLSIARSSRFDAPVTVEGAFSILRGEDAIIRMVGLTLGDKAGFDIADGTVLIDYADVSPLGRLMTPLSNGYNRGEWSQRGIFSSAAAETGVGAVAYAEAEELFNAFPRWFGAGDVDGTTVILRYTLAGDANLDRVVDLADFNRLAAAFGRPQDVDTTWTQGNFNFDGVTDLADFNILAANFGRSLPASGALRAGGPSAFAEQWLHKSTAAHQTNADALAELA